LAIACHNHHDTHKFLPSNGWGYSWVGDPDRGYGWKQPGGWMYGVLEFIEEAAIRNMGKGITPDTEKKRILGTEVPLKIVVGFHCPSRRAPILMTYLRRNPWANATDIGLTRLGVARGDYAISAGDDFGGSGDSRDCNFDMGPANYAQADANADFQNALGTCDGVSFQRSEVSFTKIEDGTSKTYLLGEKYIDPADYETGEDYGDDTSYFNGADQDTQRWSVDEPSQDQFGQQAPSTWGSAHPGAFNMAMADASVQSISYSTDLVVHRQMGNRRDGLGGPSDDD
jgi:prepilin-type processing-associated H-X9-DG protein